jgi:hypothetical protein
MYLSGKILDLYEELPLSEVISFDVNIPVLGLAKLIYSRFAEVKKQHHALLSLGHA